MKYNRKHRAADYLSDVFGSLTAAIVSLAKGFRSEFCAAAAEVQYGGTLRRATGEETARMASFVGMTSNMVRRQNTWLQGNDFGRNFISTQADLKEYTDEVSSHVPMWFEMCDLVDTKKKGEQPISCPVTSCYRVEDVVEGSCERHKFMPIGGRLEGKLGYKCGCDRGGNCTRLGGINIHHSKANSCKEYDNICCFWDGPDCFSNVYNHMFEPHEPGLVELDKGNMIIVGDVCTEGERRARAVPRECRLDDNSRRFIVDAMRPGHPRLPTSLFSHSGDLAFHDWVLCTTEEDEAIGVGQLCRGGDGDELVGFFKFSRPMKMKPNLKILTLEVEIFFVFDIDEICNVLGHQGCSSSYPCPLCDLHKEHFKTCYDDLEEKPTRRTLAGMIECKAQYDEAGGKKDKAKDFKNVTMLPMLSAYWSLEKKMVPPQVHAVTIGMGNSIWNSFLSLVRVDEKTTGNEEAREAMEEVKVLIKANKEDLIVVNSARMKLDKDNKIDKKQCYDLLPGYTPTLVTRGITTAELEKNEIPDETIKAYQLLNSTVKCRVERVKTALAKAVELKEEIALQQKAHDEYEETVFEVGPIEEAIDTTWLKSVNVSHSTYFAHDFVGGGVKRIVEKKNRESLWTFLRTEYAKAGKDIAAAEELIKKVKPLFDGFAELLHLTCAVRMLTEDEKERVLGLCKSVPRLLREVKPNSQIKTHMIEFELHQFIEYWGTVGILNEEAFESIHALMNGLNRRYACVRDRALRDKLMHKALCVLQATKEKVDEMLQKGKRKKKQRPNSAPAALGSSD
jgi:hypothetical protein